VKRRKEGGCPEVLPENYDPFTKKAGIGEKEAFEGK
jgi:hypothetical protein